MDEAGEFGIGDYQLIWLETARPEALADYQLRNRDRFAPYSPKRTEAFFTPSYWRSARRRAARERRDESAMRWVIQAEDRVVGQINLDQIVRGVFQSSMLGYSLDAAVEGRGLMTASLRKVASYAFDTLELHRICANHVPENTRSAAVLARLGFEREGFAKSYLRLNGEWKDHVLNALINPAHANSPYSI